MKENIFRDSVLSPLVTAWEAGTHHSTADFEEISPPLNKKKKQLLARKTTSWQVFAQRELFHKVTLLGGAMVSHPLLSFNFLRLYLNTSNIEYDLLILFPKVLGGKKSKEQKNELVKQDRTPLKSSGTFATLPPAVLLSKYLNFPLQPPAAQAFASAARAITAKENMRKP